MSNNANEAAFPASGSWNDNHPDIIQIQQEGLTKREYFAAMFLQTLINIPYEGNNIKVAMAYADELLKALDND